MPIIRLSVIFIDILDNRPTTMYYNFLSDDEIVWHVANAAKRRLIDQLFRVYISDRKSVV